MRVATATWSPKWLRLLPGRAEILRPAHPPGSSHGLEHKLHLACRLCIHRSFSMILKAAFTAAALLAGLALAPAQAVTLRWAAQNDILTLDPHAKQRP